MDTSLAYFILRQIVNYLSIIILPLMVIHLGRKLIKQKKETGKFNVVTFLIFSILAIYSWLNVWEFISESTPLGLIITEEFIGRTSDQFTIYTISVGLMMTVGLAMVCYANQWESLYYFAPFIFGGMIIFYLLTGFDGLLRPYISVVGAIALILLYLTGIRIKDNGSLGVAVTFTFPLVQLYFTATIPGEILNVIFLVFAIYFSLGYFKPFKEGGKLK